MFLSTRSTREIRQILKTFIKQEALVCVVSAETLQNKASSDLYGGILIKMYNT